MKRSTTGKSLFDWTGYMVHINKKGNRVTVRSKSGRTIKHGPFLSFDRVDEVAAENLRIYDGSHLVDLRKN